MNGGDFGHSHFQLAFQLACRWQNWAFHCSRWKSPSKYQDVLQSSSSKKYLKVPTCTSKYPEVPQSTYMYQFQPAMQLMCQWQNWAVHTQKRICHGRNFGQRPESTQYNWNATSKYPHRSYCILCFTKVYFIKLHTQKLLYIIYISNNKALLASSIQAIMIKSIPSNKLETEKATLIQTQKTIFKLDKPAENHSKWINHKYVNISSKYL